MSEKTDCEQCKYICNCRDCGKSSQIIFCDFKNTTVDIIKETNCKYFEKKKFIVANAFILAIR